MKAISAILLILSTGLWAVAQEMATNTNGKGTATEVGNPALSGSGKKNYVPLWLNSTKLGNSEIFQTKGDVGIGTTAPTATLDVNGAVNAATSFNLGSYPFAFGSYANSNAFLGFAGNTTATGVGNTASGYQALYSNTAGNGNTASGYQALYSNTTGLDNTASGNQALHSNTGGSANAASGGAALFSNTTGSENTADGFQALVANTTGFENTAVGYQALDENTTGVYNTASGSTALSSNTTGSANTASGSAALFSNTTGSYNTAVGFMALYNNTTGSDLTCVGYDCTADALTNATAIGAHAVVKQSNSLVLGGSGKYAVKVGIGTTKPSNILTIARGAGHPVSDSWETYSSRRWKTNIQTLHGALAKVEQLRGVSYDLKDSGKHEVGVIAEEVAAVVPEVVTWEDNGKDAQGVDYGRLTALLIQATKEQQTLIHKQQEQITQLTLQVGAIRALLKTSGRTGQQVRTVKAQVPMVHQ